MASSPLKFHIHCVCGKVKAAIEPLQTAKPLRIVCYCKDCRGYYNTLNQMSSEKEAAAKLDAWGGVDWTQVYPRDITLMEGHQHLKTCKIRTKSSIRQVYCSCCNSPMFRFGSNSVMLNTHLIVEEDRRPDVTFRIIGRQALPGDSKPKISWSVPFSWFWTMPGRVRKDLMKPTPMELSDGDVLKDFKEG